MITALFAGSTVLTPLYIIYQQSLGFSGITLTLIYAAYVLGNLAALLIFGRVSDRWGRRRSAAAAFAVAILSAVIFLFDGNLVSLYLGRILSGLSIGVGAGTGTAWLAEIIATEDKTRATAVATGSNFLGLGLGALVAGLLAQYTPWPLQWPFIAYLLALVAAAFSVWRTGETVSRPTDDLHDIPLRPKLSIPGNIRRPFVAPAITGFGSMALVGFFAAVAPNVLAHDLHQASHAVAGAIFFELAMVVAVTIASTQALSSRIAMLSALALMTPSVALLVAAQALHSMAILIAATALCGIASGLGYRGSLQVVNEIAPAQRRAEVVSSYFVCAFIGNAVPVIGVGVITALLSSLAANTTFAVMIVLFSVIAMIFGTKYQ
jgi:MFS family permease